MSGSFLAFGFVSTLIGSVGWFLAETTEKAYVRSLQDAVNVDSVSANANQTRNRLVFVSGNAVTDSPYKTLYGQYINMSSVVYEVSVKKTLSKVATDTLESQYEKSHHRVEANYLPAVGAVKIGTWDVTQFVDQFKAVNAGEEFVPVAQQGVVSVNVNTGSGTPVVVGAQERAVTGYLKKMFGTRNNEFYTIFGVVPDSKYNVLLPVDLSNASNYVFLNKTPEQAIQQAEASRMSGKILSMFLTGFGFTCLALGVIVGVEGSGTSNRK